MAAPAKNKVAAAAAIAAPDLEVIFMSISSKRELTVQRPQAVTVPGWQTAPSDSYAWD
jgi:hypothetical protein